MIPQVADVYGLARFHLGDTEIPSGQWAKDNFLQPFFGAAYNSLYRWLQRNAAQKIRRTNYWNLAANTSYLSPADAGIANMGKPEDLYERPIGVTLSGAIAAINVGNPSAGTQSSLDLTVTGHGLSSGTQVITFGFASDPNGVWLIGDDINDTWTITVLDANTIRLNGCATVGSGTTSSCTGIVTTGATTWPTRPLHRLYDFTEEFQNSPQNGCLTKWYWAGAIFRFAPATAARQLKIVYDLSGSPPESGSIGIDDSLDALATMTAALAGQSKMGMTPMVQGLFERAVGDAGGGTANIMGGHYFELAHIAVQDTQQIHIQIPRFNSRRARYGRF